MIEIYADGACIGNPGPGGWGAVIVRDGDVEAELSGHEPGTTNNRMEIRAVIEGLRRVPPGEAVRVVSDSEYVIKTQKFGWKKNKNLELWDELDRVAGARPIEWAWTRGHSGDKYNEVANDLAQNAAAAGTKPGTTSDADPPARKRLAEPPHAEGSVGNAVTADSPQTGLTHIDSSGRARMVNVGEKDVTERVAVARGAISMKKETLALIRQGGFEKGDVLGVARVAGVMAAKRTHDLIPLCHPIPLTQVTVEFDDTSSADRIEITATARATWKTGVEMEALTAVTVAALTIYDMCKAVDRGMRIEAVRLVRKSGGRSGDWASQG